MFLRAAIFVSFVIVIAINLKLGRFRLFLVTFRWWSLGFLIASVIDRFVLPLMPLSFGRMPPV
jgi:hypothetical protein